jgi:hypothetical protein
MRLTDREELKHKLDLGDDFKLVMVPGEWAFRAKHIPGSLHLDTIGSALEALDTNERSSSTAPTLPASPELGRLQDAHGERVRQRRALRRRARRFGESRVPPGSEGDAVSKPSNRKAGREDRHAIEHQIRR